MLDRKGRTLNRGHQPSRAATSAVSSRNASAPVAELSWSAMGFASIGASLSLMFSGM